MNAYQKWNDALAERFFNPDMAGRNVHLYVNQALIDEMERAMPEAGTFRVAVAGPPTDLPYCERVCQRALEAFTDWRHNDSPYPPYVGYLSLFVLAGDIGGDFAPQAYYPRLWELMVERRNGTVPYFDRMHQLWEDLEDWSVHDQQGKLGVFQARSIGGYIYVGYPLSQSLLVEEERRGLPPIFCDAGLEPGGDYPADELARSLRRPIARQILRAKTVRLVENRQDADLYNALLDAVAEELSAWDGTVPETVLAHGQEQYPPAFAGLRICMDLDRVAGTINAYIRCKLSREFPDDGLLIDGELEAGEAGNGWSLPIKNHSTGEILAASHIDWTNGETMRDDVLGLQLRLPGRDVRIFTNGIREGINGFVETHMVPRGQSFYLAYSGAVWPRLERWATTQCQGFQEIAIARGLPAGWRFASVESATSDEAVRDEFTSLSFTTGTRLRLVGGIRSRAGNNFFHFAPPSVSLVGGTPDTEVYLDDQLLPPSEDGGIFTLTGDLPTESRISLEARDGQPVDGQPVDRLSLFLTGDFSVKQMEPRFFLGSTGTSASNSEDEPSITGAYVSSTTYEPITTAAEMFEDLAYEMGGMQGFLIGQRPGQIATWPREAFPTNWIPAWAIKKQGKKLTAMFAGELLDVTQPENPSFAPTRREVQDWKKVIWHQRKRITPPRDQYQRGLWQQLQETARNV